MAKKENMLDVVIARASQSTKDEIATVKFKTTALGDIIVKIPPLEHIVDFLEEESHRGDDVFSGLLSNAELVYENTPFLVENFKALSEAYGENDPAKLTLKIFELAQALGELNSIADAITEAYGIGKEAIKN